MYRYICVYIYIYIYIPEVVSAAAAAQDCKCNPDTGSASMIAKVEANVVAPCTFRC